MWKALAIIVSTALVFGVGAVSVPADGGRVRSVVLVHGGFVDGSGWEGVYSILKMNGYEVTIVQNSTTSLADDVAVTKRAIAAASGKVILVGHSYGGVVVSEAGTDPKVAGTCMEPGWEQVADDALEWAVRNARPGNVRNLKVA